MLVGNVQLVIWLVHGASRCFGGLRVLWYVRFCMCAMRVLSNMMAKVHWCAEPDNKPNGDLPAFCTWTMPC